MAENQRGVVRNEERKESITEETPMPQVCTICRHRRRQEIDEALLAGDPLRSIADRYGLSKTALIRHKSDHLPAQLVKAKGAAEVLSADLLHNRLEELRQETLCVLRLAKKARDNRTLLAAIGRLEGQLRLVAEMAGQLRSRTRPIDHTHQVIDPNKMEREQLAHWIAYFEQQVALKRQAQAEAAAAQIAGPVTIEATVER
jgi:hypothetical protein